MARSLGCGGALNAFNEINDEGEKNGFENKFGDNVSC